MNRTMLVLVDDLFWRTKIEHALKSAQTPLVFVSEPAGLAAAADPAKIGAVLVDLSIRKEPFSAIAALKKDQKTREIPVLGFFEHARTDLQKKGLAAGCDEVLSRSQFSQKMGDVILKYAMPGSVRAESEEEELPEE